MFAKCGYQSVYGTVYCGWERRNGKTIYQKTANTPEFIISRLFAVLLYILCFSM